MLRRVSHLGLAVRDLDAAIRLYEGVFGLQVTHRWTAEADGMQAAALHVGDLEIELMQPMREDSPVARFIERRGGGPPHVAYKGDDVAEALGKVEEFGVGTGDK